MVPSTGANSAMQPAMISMINTPPNDDAGMAPQQAPDAGRGLRPAAAAAESNSVFSALVSSIAYPRIEQGVGDIDQPG